MPLRSLGRKKFLQPTWPHFCFLDDFQFLDIISYKLQPTTLDMSAQLKITQTRFISPVTLSKHLNLHSSPVTTVKERDLSPERDWRGSFVWKLAWFIGDIIPLSRPIKSHKRSVQPLLSLLEVQWCMLDWRISAITKARSGVEIFGTAAVNFYIPSYT